MSLIRSCAKRDMHESKRGALTVNASMEDETEDEIRDERKTKWKTNRKTEEHGVFVSHESARGAFVVVGC